MAGKKILIVGASGLVGTAAVEAVSRSCRNWGVVAVVAGAGAVSLPLGQGPNISRSTC